MKRIPLVATVATAAIGLGGATAIAATPASTPDHVTAGAKDRGTASRAKAPAKAAAKADRSTDLATTVRDITRNTAWKQVSTLDLKFDTFHPQGLVVTDDRIYLSSVEIIEPTTRFPAPVNGMDRTVGKGRGHVFVMDRKGTLLKDVIVGEGDSYHPGGIDTDGRNIWVSVAQYRPNSHAIVYKIDTKTLTPRKMFEVNDHVGGILLDKTTGHLIGNTWGSRRFYEWTTTGRQLRTWLNESHFIDYQDCNYAAQGKAVCTGVANLPAAPGSTTPYELGGIALIDIATGQVEHEAPIQQWSTAGHVITRNPVDVASDGKNITLYAAPDDFGEGKNTQILTWTAEVPSR